MKPAKPLPPRKPYKLYEFHNGLLLSEQQFDSFKRLLADEQPTANPNDWVKSVIEHGLCADGDWFLAKPLSD